MLLSVCPFSFFRAKVIEKGVPSKETPCFFRFICIQDEYPSREKFPRAREKPELRFSKNKSLKTSVTVTVVLKRLFICMLSFSKGDRRSEKRPETASLQGILDGNVSDFIAIFRSFLKKNTTIRYLEAIKMAGKGVGHLLLLRNKNSCWYGRSMTGDTTVP